MIWFWKSSRTLLSTPTTTKRFSTYYPFLVSLAQVTACACFPSVSPAFVIAASQHKNINTFSKLEAHPFPTKVRTTTGPRMSSTLAVDAEALAQDIEGYNSCISATVSLSNAYVIQHGDQMVLRVTRTVEDIDNDKKRNYQYVLPILPSNNDAAALPLLHIPPTEINANIQMEIPTKSGNKMAIIRVDENSSTSSSDTSPARQVLEIWTTNTGDPPSSSPPSLVRRIALPTNIQHGKVINDGATFGRPCWDSTETVLVYLAERKKPETTSFFDPQNFQVTTKTDKTKAIPGGKSTLGLGKSEGWGEQYHQQEPLLDFFLVNVTTGRIGKVENVPGIDPNDDDDSPSLRSYSLGQPVFSPDGHSLVYTAWDAGGGSDMPKRLGLIYCQQRPCKIYASNISNLLEHISQPGQYPLDPKSDETIKTETNNFICLTPHFRLSKSP